MCVKDDCYNKIFSGDKCIKHYRYEKYGECKLEGCYSPAMGLKGLCDNCSRRGEPKRRHYGKHINTDSKKYCEGCSRILKRTCFYIDRGSSSYLCKSCHSKRRSNAKIRAKAYEYGIRNVVQTNARVCVKCWLPLGKWEIDHVIPKSLGGSDSIEKNIQIMCVSCNRRKSNRESIDYRKWIEKNNN